MTREGKKGNFCPYYQQNERVTDADIIFMPYNYMLDDSMRQNFKLDLQRSIIIFDEAHNVGQCAEQSQSFEISENLLKLCSF